MLGIMFEGEIESVPLMSDRTVVGLRLARIVKAPLAKALRGTAIRIDTE